MLQMPVQLPQFFQDLKTRIVFFLFVGNLFFNLHHAFGQDQRVADSLAIIYQEDNLEGTEKLELLKELAFNELNDRELLLKYAEELIQLAELENDSRYLFSGYLQRGEYHKKMGELELALENYFKAVDIAVDSKNIKNETKRWEN